MRAAVARLWFHIALAMVLVGWCLLAVAGGEAQRSIETGNRYWEAGDLDRAEASYRRAMEQEPGSVDAHMKLAGLYIARQRYKAGVETYSRFKLFTIPCNPLWASSCKRCQSSAAP